MALFSWFRPQPDLADTLPDIERRLAELESLQLAREIEWQDTKGKLLRYLKRVSEIERRETVPGKGASRALLTAKFGSGDRNHRED